MQVNFERAIAQLMKRWEEMTKGEKPLHVDIAMISRQDALDFGRQEVLVIIPKGE